MYGPEVRLRALELIESGSALRAISLSTGISRSTLREWRDHPERPYRSRAYCPRCGTEPSLPEPYADYAYLLGLYLGDGCISASGDPAKGVWKLRVMCADAWPGLVGECVRAMQAVRPANKVTTQQKQGCTEVLSHSRHWPCLFPQHGPGRKHSRTIELADWHQGEHHFGGEEGRRGAAGWVRPGRSTELGQAPPFVRYKRKARAGGGGARHYGRGPRLSLLYGTAAAGSRRSSLTAGSRA